MKTHYLKTWPEYFKAVADGTKPFEVRFCKDRTFAIGDLLILQEYNPDYSPKVSQGQGYATVTTFGGYTGREERRTVTYILPGGSFGIELGYCVLGLGAVQELAEGQHFRIGDAVKPTSKAYFADTTGIKAGVILAFSDGNGNRITDFAGAQETNPYIVVIEGNPMEWCCSGADLEPLP